MARDALELDVGGELRDRFGRPEIQVVSKHFTPLTTDVQRGYQPADQDGRVQQVMSDWLGNDLSESIAPHGLNVMAPKFGARGDGATDDTSAIQSAINAASTAAGLNGKVNVIFPPGRTFLFGNIAPKSGVVLWAYGATMVPIGGSLGATAWIGVNATLQLQRFQIRGGNWIGAGTETVPLYKVTDGASNTDFTIQDTTVVGWGAGPFYIVDGTRVRVIDNTIINPGANGLLNAINFVFGNIDPNQMSTVLARGNIVTGAEAAGIALVMHTGAAPAGSWSLFMVIDGNVITGASDGAANDVSGSIDLENTPGGGPFGRIIVANNHTTNNRPSTNAYACTVEAGFTDVLVIGNTFTSTQRGVLLSGNGVVSFIGNRINAPTPVFTTGTPTLYQVGNRYTAGNMQGRATLVAGTVTVNTTEVQAGDNIVLSTVVKAGTQGILSVGTIVAGTSFVINSNNAADTSTVYWKIDH